MSYLKINDRMYVCMQEVPKLNKTVTIEPLHHIFLLDRSGSMGWTINQLIDHVYLRAASLREGDTLTVGYFSGESEWRFPIKGFQIGPNNYPKLRPLFDSMRSTLSTTCFSQILKDCYVVIDELAPIYTRFALTMFTDGCPVVSNYQRELVDIFNAIQHLAPRLSSVLLVGYGGYYNKELMAEMATKLGGSLAHADTIDTFAVQLADFTATAEETNLRVKVALETNTTYGVPFSITGQQVTLHMPCGSDDGDFVSFAPSKKGKDYLYTLTDHTGAGHVADLASFDLNTNFRLPHIDKIEALVRGAYGAAYMLAQTNNIPEALSVLGALGDVALIDAVNNAFTVEDYGRVEVSIAQAIHTPAKRFTGGFDTAYLPKDDAFCVLDALELLMQDDKACFYPRHHDFQYTRIGARSVSAVDTPIFVADPLSRCAFNTLTWHKELLNLSVLAHIPGTVDLGPNAAAYGFAQNYPSYIWRNYAIVKDGMLHTPALPVSLSMESWQRLLGAGCIDPCNYHGPDHVYLLRLNRLPVVNRAIGSGLTSAAVLCDLVAEELLLMARLKVLRWRLALLGEPTDLPSVLTQDQINFLAYMGIGKNGFSPVTTKLEPTDYYYVRSFAVQVKGFSSLPPVDKVQDKIEAGKKLTPAENYIALGLSQLDTLVEGTSKAQREWLELQTARFNRVLRQVRNQIQRTKFAVILGKRWFTEFPDRKDCVLEHNGLKFEFKLRDDVRIDL